MIQADGSANVLTDALTKVPGVVNVTHERDNRYDVEARNDLRAETARAVVTAGGKLLSLTIETPSLDDIYERYFKEAEHGSTR